MKIWADKILESICYKLLKNLLQPKNPFHNIQLQIWAIQGNKKE